MKIGKIWMTFVAIVLLLALSTSVLAISVTLNRVELDDQELSRTALNRLDVTRDGTVEIEVKLTPSQNVKDVEVMALISGYEYNKDSRITDVTPLFDADVGVTYVKKLTLTLPDTVDEDNYRLRIIVTDRDSTQLVQDYLLKLDVPRHKLVVEDVLLYPGTSIRGGDSTLVTVRLENKGEKTEDDVKVTASIPQLKVSASDFIDEIKNEKQEETEELLLRIPKCAEAGTYSLQIIAEYNNGRNKVLDERNLIVARNTACDEETKPVVTVATLPPVAAPELQPVQVMSKLRRALEIVLVGLLVLLVIIGLIIGFAKLSSRED